MAEDPAEKPTTPRHPPESADAERARPGIAEADEAQTERQAPNNADYGEPAGGE